MTNIASMHTNTHGSRDCLVPGSSASTLMDCLNAGGPNTGLSQHSVSLMTDLKSSGCIACKDHSTSCSSWLCCPSWYSPQNASSRQFHG